MRRRLSTCSNFHLDRRVKPDGSYHRVKVKVDRGRHAVTGTPRIYSVPSKRRRNRNSASVVDLYRHQ